MVRTNRWEKGPSPREKVLSFHIVGGKWGFRIHPLTRLEIFDLVPSFIRNGPDQKTKIAIVGEQKKRGRGGGRTDQTRHMGTNTGGEDDLQKKKKKKKKNKHKNKKTQKMGAWLWATRG